MAREWNEDGLKDELAIADTERKRQKFAVLGKRQASCGETADGDGGDIEFMRRKNSAG